MVLHAPSGEAPAQTGAARDAHGRISDDAIQGFIETLLEFRRSVGDHPARVVATASLRQASNRHEIQETVRKVVGWDLEILTGRQEALAAYQGTVRNPFERSPTRC